MYQRTEFNWCTSLVDFVAFLEQQASRRIQLGTHEKRITDELPLTDYLHQPIV